MQFAKRELDVGIATRNAEAQKAFYEEVLGFAPAPEISLGELGRELCTRVGGHTIRFYDFAQPPEPCEGGTDKAIGIRLLAFILDDLDAVLARCDAKGHAYRRMALPDSTPYQVAFSSDADGNALELVGLRKPAGPALTVRMQVGLTVSDI